MVQLAKTEKWALAECEEIIERGLDCFIEVGNALLRVRNEKLYREQFEDFQTYCSLKWGMNRAHAYRMIEAAEVAANLSPIGDIPSSESVVRPLVKLPAPVQRKAWKAAVQSSKNGKPTAKEVAAAVVKTLPEVRDAIINRIPEARGGPTPVVRINGTVKNSAVLRELKRLWKRATLNDREQFRVWIGEQ